MEFIEFKKLTEFEKCPQPKQLAAQSYDLRNVLVLRGNSWFSVLRLHPTLHHIYRIIGGGHTKPRENAGDKVKYWTFFEPAYV